MFAHWFIAVILLTAPVGAQSPKAGIEAWGRGDYAAALGMWRPLAAKGSSDAMFNLGQAYRLGRGVPVDLAQASGWYERSAQSGKVDAQTQLGMMLFEKGDRANGLRWLKLAADKEDARAQLMLGTALFNGDGIARDPLTAYGYVCSSALQGFEPAKATLKQIEGLFPTKVHGDALVGGSSKPAQASTNLDVMPVAVPRTRPADLPPLAVADNWRVQLGAFAHRIAAENLSQKYAGGPLAGKASFLVPAGTFVRVQSGPFSTQSGAATACVVLRRLGQPCFVVGLQH